MGYLQPCVHGVHVSSHCSTLHVLVGCISCVNLRKLPESAHLDAATHALWVYAAFMLSCSNAHMYICEFVNYTDYEEAQTITVP
jgi:hypothetical protein